nr:ATP-binding cassette domain-containing protein [Bifidobacterium cuniculi]
MPWHGGERTVFRGLGFHVDRGEVVDLTGPSGSGKSTLLTAFARLNVHATGTFLLDGKDSDAFTPQTWRSAVAYLPQTPTLMGDTVADAIRLPWTLGVRRGGGAREPGDLLSDARIRAMLDRMGCRDVSLDHVPRDLSGGQAARVSLARTLLTKPRVLLADEVDAGLDEGNAEKVADLLKDVARQGAAVVRIRHRAPDGRATRMVVLEDGMLRDVPVQPVTQHADPFGGKGR